AIVLAPVSAPGVTLKACVVLFSDNWMRPAIVEETLMAVGVKMVADVAVTPAPSVKVGVPELLVTVPPVTVNTGVVGWLKPPRSRKPLGLMTMAVVVSISLSWPVSLTAAKFAPGVGLPMTSEVPAGMATTPAPVLFSSRVLLSTVVVPLYVLLA